MIILDEGSDYQLMLRPEIDELIISEDGIKVIKLQGDDVEMETEKYLVELVDDELTILDKEKGKEVDINGFLPDSFETSGSNNNIAYEDKIEELKVLDNSEIEEQLLILESENDKDSNQDNEKETSINEAKIITLYYLAFGFVSALLVVVGIYIWRTFFTKED